MRYLKLKLSLSLLLILLFFSSCFTPRSVIRVYPEEERILRWNYGQAYVGEEKNDLEIMAAYSDYNELYLVFDVEVTNYGTEDILVTPEKIWLEAYGAKVPAMDPEKLLLQLDIDLSKQEARQKNTTLVLGVAAVAGTVALIASDPDGSNNQETTINNGSANLVAAGIYAGASSASVANRPPPVSIVNRSLWSNHCLRKTTVGPDERIGGKVLFKRMDTWQEMQMIIPVGDIVFTLPFKQIIYQP